MISDPVVEELILAPVDDKQYAKRIRLLRENFKHQQLKYRKAQQEVAEHKFRLIFREASA
jgi:hypothetical protein